MIRRTRRGDIISNRHMHTTKPWFHFPVGTPMERITVATEPVISVDEQQRLRLIRNEQRRCISLERADVIITGTPVALGGAQATRFHAARPSSLKSVAKA